LLIPILFARREDFSVDRRGERRSPQGRTPFGPTCLVAAKGRAVASVASHFLGCGSAALCYHKQKVTAEILYEAFGITRIKAVPGLGGGRPGVHPRVGAARAGDRQYILCRREE